MPVHWDKRNKVWRFQFNRVIEGKQIRAGRLLPAGWSKSQADAYERKESARLYAVGSGVTKPELLIEKAVAHYLRDKTHLKSYKGAAENLAAIAWAYRGKTFDEVADVARLICETPEGVRKGVVLKPATIKQRLALMKAACRWGWKRHGMGDADPTARMQMPAVNNERDVYASRKQMLQMARKADRHDVRVLIRAAFYTGMRLSELMRVEVGDGVLRLKDTKNGEKRSIPVHPRLATCLPYLPIAGVKRTLQAGWSRARRRCQMDHMHLHDLRHSAASEMVNNDVDLFIVGKVLGHKDPRSTARYSHLTHEKLAAAIGAIGRKVGKKPAHTPADEGEKKDAA